LLAEKPSACASRPKPWFGFALLDPRLGKVPRATSTSRHGIIRRFVPCSSVYHQVQDYKDDISELYLEFVFFQNFVDN